LKPYLSVLSSLFDNLGRYVLAMSRPAKRLFVMAVDSFLCFFSLWFSFYLQLGEFLSIESLLTFPLIITSTVSVFLAVLIFARSGLYRAIFRYSGISAMVTMTRAMFIYGLLFSIVVLLFGVQGVPRTIGLTQPIVLFVLINFSRAIAGAWIGSLYLNKVRRTSLPQVLIYGAGSAGRHLAQGMVNSQVMNVAGFLDDDARLHGQSLGGQPIFNPDDIEKVINQHGITDILLALPSASRDSRNKIIALLSRKKISVRTLPDLSDIVSGKVIFTDVQELNIDDLLSREPVEPIKSLLIINTINKTILVTGAGGSIGSELCRQLLKSKPRRLLLLDISEYALYQIHQEIQTLVNLYDGPPAEGIELVPLLASVCDEVRMEEIIRTWKPNTIYHTAAYKHVPLVEQNPVDGVRNNVWGTKVCAENAARHGVQNFVMISTDKAVRPTNIMGASKRLSEILLQALNETRESVDLRDLTANNTLTRTKTSFSIVRFGNVLGSSGSVVPLFRDQIKRGGPITLTHQDITRYFMTIAEAAQLVIQAGSMGSGGDVFVLDMGKPVRIYELARRMVELSGMTLRNGKNPYGDIEIKVMGLRPGEKLYEEILIGNDTHPTQHPRILKANEKFIPWDQLRPQLETLKMALDVSDVTLIRSVLQQLVTEYQPSEEVADWVYLEYKRQTPNN